MSAVFAVVLWMATHAHIKGESEFESISLKGDVILGGLFPVHHESSTSPLECGPIDEQPGLQYLLAMMYAIEQINNNPDILPDLTLGAKIFDTCKSQRIGTDRAKSLIRHTLSCSDKESHTLLVGVIGPLVSDVSIATANLFRVFDVTQISYGSTSPDLSNKQLYPNFFRTVPSDEFQAEAIKDLLRKFNWNYIFSVHSDGNYGTNGAEKLREALARLDMCVADEISLPSSPRNDDYERIVSDLLLSPKYGNAKVIVLFTTPTDAHQLLRAANKDPRARDRFAWVGSNGWSNREVVTNGNEKIAEGAITFGHLQGEVPGFERYIKSLSPRKNNTEIIPWFDEFWQFVLKCRLEDSTKPSTFNRKCAENESLPEDLEIAPVKVVINAVYAMAHALDKLLRRFCADLDSGPCDMKKSLAALHSANVLRRKLYESLLNISFPDSASIGKIQFNEKGEVNGQYNVMTFRKINGKYRYVTVGSWKGQLEQNGNIQGRLLLNNSALFWKQRSAPESVCSQKCPTAHVTRHSTDNPVCCWECQECDVNHFIVNDICQSCLPGYLSNANRSDCYKAPVVYIKANEQFPIIFMSLSCLGLISTLTTGALFVKHRNHKIIKASSRELSVFSFAGTVVCYVGVFFYFLKPSLPVCYMRNIAASVGLAICYAPVLLKTIRIYRIFKTAQLSPVPPYLISPTSQVLICVGMITVQALITAVWLISDRQLVNVKYQPARTILECDTSGYSLVIVLSYNLILMLTATFYAFKTRKFPKNFNEAKHTGITMYITCSVWLTLLPTYLMGEDATWQTYVATTAHILTATINLVGFLVLKIFWVYFKRNTPDINQSPVLPRTHRLHEMQGVRGFTL